MYLRVHVFFMLKTLFQLFSLEMTVYSSKEKQTKQQKQENLLKGSRCVRKTCVRPRLHHGDLVENKKHMDK